MRRYDCAIAGSGVSGLTAAVALASRGAKVAVLEKNFQPAPLCRRYETKTGARLDFGFHYMGLGGESALMATLRSLGAADALKPIFFAADETDAVRFTGREFCFPIGYDALGEALAEAFPESRRAVAAYVAEVRRVNRENPLLAPPASGLPPPFLGRQPSLSEFLKARGAGPDLTAFLGAYGRIFYGTTADEVPFEAHALAMGGLYEAPGTFAGGGGALVAALLDRFLSLGGEIFTGSPVEGVALDGSRRVTAVRLRGGDILATSRLIWTAHPALLEKLLPPGSVRPIYRRNLTARPSGFAPSVAFVRGPRRRRATYGLADDGFFGVLPPRESDDNVPLTLFSSNRLLGSPRRAGEIAAALIRDAEDLCLESRGELTPIAAAGPLFFERLTGSVGGAAYGFKPTVEEAPLFPVTPIDGLFLAGQSVKLPGVQGAVFAAINAIRHLNFS